MNPVENLEKLLSARHSGASRNPAPLHFGHLQSLDPGLTGPSAVESHRDDGQKNGHSRFPTGAHPVRDPPTTRLPQAPFAHSVRSYTDEYGS